ncbi:hypothetical protein A7985_09015 [Pseudoalteromonas luteoviolacea]|uniref:Uncharacterized protein n=1 Tax=Pseudoalteromonas luteoviolacea TaxID=43657 RepID=A0A1C0TRQ9_9GAMM|nr:hypothetical protein [Pseudoalteromonas luteoviolacea]OCQ21939.1 hypothetical protein A7985_09015 [Pseudoalteromonas luteoviolacea]
MYINKVAAFNISRIEIEDESKLYREYEKLLSKIDGISSSNMTIDNEKILRSKMLEAGLIEDVKKLIGANIITVPSTFEVNNIIQSSVITGYQRHQFNVFSFLICDELVQDSSTFASLEEMFYKSFEQRVEEIRDFLKFSLVPVTVFILGYSFTKSELEIQHIDTVEKQNEITKQLEFPPEYYQSGVNILSYFSEVLRQKYPDVQATVSIEQEGSKVRMIVSLPCGSIDIVERALETYSLVVINKADPRELLDNDLHIQQLSHKLEMANMEIRHTNSLLQIEQARHSERVNDYKDRVESLEQKVNSLTELFANQQSLTGQSQKTTQSQVGLMSAQVNQNNKTLDGLIASLESSSDTQLLLIDLKETLETNTLSPKKAEEVATLICKQSPSTSKSLIDLMENSMYGASGNLLFTALQEAAKAIV